MLFTIVKQAVEFQIRKKLPCILSKLGIGSEVVEFLVGAIISLWLICIQAYPWGALCWWYGKNNRKPRLACLGGARPRITPQDC